MNPVAQHDKKLVAVEDDQFIPMQMRMVLTSACGYRDENVIIVGDGESFKAAVLANKPDVILMDNDFPPMPGEIETRGLGLLIMQEINEGKVPGAEKAGRGMMSSSATEDDAKNAGADVFLPKPYRVVTQLPALIAEAEAAGVARAAGQTTGGHGDPNDPNKLPSNEGSNSWVKNRGMRRPGPQEL